jgi:hypothetical protein
MKLRLLRRVGWISIPVVVLAGVLLVVSTHSGTTNPIAQYYMEYVPPAGAPGVFSVGSAGPAITPTCTTWHELYPSFCVDHHQEGFGDNGDGVLSACDCILLDNMYLHVDWVGPTYVLVDVQTGGQSWWEPDQDPVHNPDQPVCETWHQVYPLFCGLGHVDDWFDENGDGTLSICDIIIIDGISYHIVDISLNIQVSDSVPTPNEKSSWGKIKQLFEKMF